VLSLSNITKRFGATLALDDVSLDIAPGEIIGLVGENGAGKTTLMGIAAREIAPDAGTVRASGGVGFVHQHFLLVNEFTVAENLELALRRADIDTDIAMPDLQRRVADLSVGERAKVELVKAIASRPEVLILDEPTAVLSPLEAEELFAVMRRFAAGGTAIVFISHKIPEVIAVATRVVVMRRGRIVAERRELNAEELAQAMVETSLATGVKPSRTAGRAEAPPRIMIDGLAVAAGEIVAIIGVAGNGQSELAARLRRELRSAKAGFIPEDRTRDGIVAEMSIAENLLLGGTKNAQALIEKFSIRARGPQQRAGTLSGGNQQKVILARELARDPESIIAAEPTRGLDIESTLFVHDQLRAAAARGAAVLLITSDLDEAFELADAIHVIYRGRLSDRLAPAEAAERAPRLMAGIA
jgi:simple sugar transport system ATP-binding protein